MTFFKVILVLFTVKAFAYIEVEEITISGKQNKKLNSSTEIVTAKKNIKESLSQASGVSFVSTGPNGNPSIFLRGNDHAHTLVLINGVRVYDPTSLNRSFDLSTINANDIEKIEVLKGNQSTLYGSDAIGGVVNIILKTPKAKHLMGIAGGVNNKIYTTLNHNTETFVSSLNFYNEGSENISEVRGGDELDKNENKGGSYTFGVELHKFAFDGLIKVSDSFTETDGQDFATDIPVDSDINYAKKTHQLYNLNTSYKVDNNNELVLELSKGRVDRVQKTSFGRTPFKGEDEKQELRFLRENKTSSYVIGLENSKESYQDNSFTDSHTTQEGFIYTTLIRGNNQIEVGLRQSEILTYNLAYKNRLGQSSSAGIHFSKGFKAPSLYQRYAPEFAGKPVGNKNLRPEVSDQVEINFAYHLIELNLFQNIISDYITYSQDGGYENEVSNTIQGVELMYSLRNFKASLEHLKFDLESGKRVERRPTNTLKLNYTMDLNSKVNLGLNYKLVGSRYEYIKDDLTELDAYDLLNLRLTYTQNDDEAYLAIENVLGEDYEEAAFYATYKNAIEVGYERLF